MSGTVETSQASTSLTDIAVAVVISTSAPDPAPTIAVLQRGQSKRTLSRKRKLERDERARALTELHEQRRSRVSDGSEEDSNDIGLDTLPVPKVLSSKEIQILSMSEAIELLESDDKIRDILPVKESTQYYMQQREATLKYLRLMANGGEKMKASTEVAEAIFGSKSESSYKGRRIRDWAKHFLSCGKLEERKQGKHPKVYSIILEEEFRRALQQAVAAMVPNSRTTTNIKSIIEKELFPSFHSAPTSVSVESVRRWLCAVGVNPSKDSNTWQFSSDVSHTSAAEASRGSATT